MDLIVSNIQVKDPSYNLPYKPSESLTKFKDLNTSHHKQNQFQVHYRPKVKRQNKKVLKRQSKYLQPWDKEKCLKETLAIKRNKDVYIKMHNFCSPKNH